MLQPLPRLVGVDVGTKRVGLATADPTGLAAQPRGAYSPNDALAELKRLHAAPGGLSGVVVGWPLDEDGDDASAQRFVAPYVRRIEKALPGVPVYPVDERYSTMRAGDVLHATGRRRTKDGLDSTAAALILQDYLDGV
jgi:putative Holliday junction resolvase